MAANGIFDVISGTSTGGLMMCMLLNLVVDECIEQYKRLHHGIWRMPDAAEEKVPFERKIPPFAPFLGQGQLFTPRLIPLSWCNTAPSRYSGDCGWLDKRDLTLKSVAPSQLLFNF
jgi:hypothetical protein